MPVHAEQSGGPISSAAAIMPTVSQHACGYSIKMYILSPQLACM